VEVEHLLRPITRWLRETGAGTSGRQVVEALATLRGLARLAMAATADFDVVLTPTLAQVPRPVGGLRNDDDPAAEFAAMAAFTPFTAPYNVSGQPAISMPLHWDEGGLPVGVQLVGRPYDEPTLFSLAHQLEDASGCATRRPPTW
jgi:amidase